MEGNGHAKPKTEDAAKEKTPPPGSSLWSTHRDEFLSLLPFLWPKEEPKLKVFIVLAFVCLISAKLFNIMARPSDTCCSERTLTTAFAGAPCAQTRRG